MLVLVSPKSIIMIYLTRSQTRQPNNNSSIAKSGAGKQRVQKTLAADRAGLLRQRTTAVKEHCRQKDAAKKSQQQVGEQVAPVQPQPSEKGLQSGTEDRIGAGKQVQKENDHRQGAQKSQKDLPKAFGPLSSPEPSAHDQKGKIQKG